LVKRRNVKEKRKNNFLGILLMSKPGKVLKALCKKLGVRLTVKRGKKRIYKSVAVLKRQCANKKKKKVKRKRKFGSPIDRRKIIERRRETRKDTNPLTLRNFFYDEKRVKEAKKYFLERQRLREAQDFDALEKLIQRKLNEYRNRDRFMKTSRKPVNVRKGISKIVKAVNPDNFKYEVEGSKPGSKYSIDLLHMACTCGDFRFRRSDKSKDDPSRVCKHIDQIFRQKGISQQQWCEHVGKEGSVDPEVMNSLLGLSTFGKKKAKYGSKKVKRKVKKRKVKRKRKSLKQIVKDNSALLGIGIGGAAALSGGIGINKYLDNLYIKILTLQIPLESVNKNLQKYFNQLFVTQEFFRDNYNTTRNVFFIPTVRSNEYNMSGNKRLEQDFIKFDKKIKGKIKKIKEKYKGLNNDIMDQVINYKLYNDYRYFVIQHYKDLGYVSIKNLLEHVRFEIFYSENKYKLKYHLDDLKRLQ
jgi:hypothetical protein